MPPAGSNPRARRLQAVKNDGLILEAARDVFIADPTAPISAVAVRAGVGIAAVYRRYESKESLLRTLCANGLKRYVHETNVGLEDCIEGDPWEAFTEWMGRIVDADTNSLVQRLAGLFTPTAEMYGDAADANRLTTELIALAKADDRFRGDVGLADIALTFEMLASVRLGDPDRTRQIRRRLLTLFLDSLQAPAAELPGPAPTWDELERRWQP